MLTVAYSDSDIGRRQLVIGEYAEIWVGLRPKCCAPRCCRETDTMVSFGGETQTVKACWRETYRDVFNDDRSSYRVSR